MLAEVPIGIEPIILWLKTRCIRQYAGGQYKVGLTGLEPVYSEERSFTDFRNCRYAINPF